MIEKSLKKVGKYLHEASKFVPIPTTGTDESLEFNTLARAVVAMMIQKEELE